MTKEVMNFLRPEKGGIYLDATAGMGGHCEAILQRNPSIRKLVAMDWDQDALDIARERLRAFGNKVRFYQANFKDMELVLAEESEKGFNGILMDLGLSSFQLDHSGRGFSFQRDEPLDMRMDRSITVMASDMVNNLPQERLEELIRLYGEERWAKKISMAIVERRRERPILTTGELSEIVTRAIPRRFHPRKIHPATRTFQAIRIAINREFENLTQALEKAAQCLLPGGALVVISFHSLEDRIVKQKIRSFENGCTCPRDFPECVCGFKPSLKSVSKKPFKPAVKEILENPMARSARLRAAESL